MRDIAPALSEWLHRGHPVALATVIRTWGSAPRRAGAKMAIGPEGHTAGSVSGGCVEGAVIQAGLEVLASGVPRRLQFGVADETAWEVGLACGGKLEIFVEVLRPDHFWFLAQAQANDSAAGSLTVIEGPPGTLGRKISLRKGTNSASMGDDLGPGALRTLEEAVASGTPGGKIIEDSPFGPLDAFADVFLPQPSLVVVGGVHVAQALTRLASVLGYRTTVVDPRRTFATRDRFPDVDRLIPMWPEKAFAELTLTPSSAIAILTHDTKIDDPALLSAIRSPAFYIGALGSMETQAKRRRRLLEAGASERELSRLHAPIGISIGAQEPEEIALAIMAEVVSARRRGRE